MKEKLRRNGIRTIFFVFGLLFLALGINLMSIVPRLGLSPWDSFFIALRSNFGWTLGGWMFVSNFIFFVATLAMKRENVSIGTAVTMLLISAFVDGIHYTLLPYFMNAPQVINFTLGACLIGYGIGIYVSSALCYAPQEGFMLALSEKLQWSFGAIQNLTAATVLLISYLLKEPVFWGTLILVLTTGSITQLAMRQAKNLLTLLTKEMRL